MLFRSLLLWSMTQSFGSAPQALTGALGGILIAVVIGALLARGALKLNLRTFFAWTGGFLVIVAAGVLAYALMDLQEAGVVPGPFSALAPVEATGAGVTGWATQWPLASTRSSGVTGRSAIGSLVEVRVPQPIRVRPVNGLLNH